MKKKLEMSLILLLILFLFEYCGSSFKEERKAVHTETKKILVVYFSPTGNIQKIASQIHESVNSDISEIQTTEPYLGDNNEVVKQTAQAWGYKPSLKSKIVNMKSYDVIFIGYPAWWNTIPAPVLTFLSEYDLSEKTIVPFSMDYGKGLGRSVDDITILCPKSTVLNGFAVDSSNIENSPKEVSRWLFKNKFIE